MESRPGLHYIFPMKHYSTILIQVLIFISLTGQLFAIDPLWAKTMFYTDPENAEQAESMNMLSQERNRSGELTKTIEMVFSRDEVLQDFVLIHADENGKDVTDRVRRRNQKREDNDRDNYVHQIFNPEKADRLSLIPRGITAIINGRECRIYDFRLEDEWPMGPGKPKSVVEEGMVFIEIESGLPLKLTSTMVDGPDAVKSFNFSMSGGAGPTGLWRVNQIRMDFAARMIIYKAGGFTMTFNYRE
ncbi:MAG: hypothetical protein KAH21_11995 [Spirochaetaceae bacterium]|nr:hypothetical protein [Spirochaetaceae bacterium]